MAPFKPVFTLRLDACAFLLPVVIALVLHGPSLKIAKEKVPGWAFLSLVVAVDVAHVWATLFRTFLDRRELLRRPNLYLGAPIVAFFASFVVHYVGGRSTFWTLLSYYAIWHFIKQDIGLLFLYIGRAGVRVSKQQIQLEKAALFAGAFCPLLLWHASPPNDFHWFRANERFLFTTPAALVLYVALELRSYSSGVPPNVGKLFVMGASWLTWAVGTLCDHEVVTLAYLNLFHGIPFFVMVFMYCQRRWASLEPAACTDRLTALVTRSWPLFIGFLVALALTEQLLWDALLEFDYIPKLCRDAHSALYGSDEDDRATVCARLWFSAADDDRTADELRGMGSGLLLNLSPAANSALTAALALPQLTHYILDAHIWKMDPRSNPKLREYLLGPTPPRADDAHFRPPSKAGVYARVPTADPADEPGRAA